MLKLHTQSEILAKVLDISVDDMYTVKSKDDNHQKKLKAKREMFFDLQLKVLSGEISVKSIKDRHWEIILFAMAMCNEPIYAASVDAILNKMVVN